MAQIGIQQKMSSLEITQPKANMQIEQPPAKLSIRTKKGKLTIDQSQAWEEMNIKSTRKWIESFAKKGKEAVKSGMARRSKQGAALMDIHLPGNPIREQAIINGHPQMKNLSITYIPSPFSVKSSYQPSQVHIDAITNQAVIEAVGSVPTINVQQGGVFIHMTKHATLHIEVASQNTKS